MEDNVQQANDSTSRRSFLLKGLVVGGAIGTGLVASGLPAFAEAGDGSLTQGDAAILRFLAAAEILESDLWQQYNELGGIQDSEVPGGSGNATYTAALAVLDADMAQYIHDNTEDEISHFTFINAYLASKGAATVNLDKFRTLPSSKATGARQIGRLTNLMQLTVDTSWWTKYRSRSKNPDFGDTFPQAVPGLMKGKFPAIPRNDGDLTPHKHIQAIANTAGFHFAFIEQGGTSLYATLAQKVTSLEVLRILLSIGGSEIMHFQTWQDKAGNATPLTDFDPINNSTVTFADLTTGQPETLQANLVMPEPCEFISPNLPACAIIRPTGPGQLDATGAINSFISDGLFRGQSQTFLNLVSSLARAADAAHREIGD